MYYFTLILYIYIKIYLQKIKDINFILLHFIVYIKLDIQLNL